MDKIKVIIADDKAIYRKLIAEMLEPAHATIVGEAADGKQLLRLLRTKNADLVLLDLDMPVMDGNKAFDLISGNFPNVKVVILSFYFDQVLVEHYLKRGAKGYIPKDALEQEVLTEALSVIQKGKVYTHEKFAGKTQFTERQKQIMPLIFEGLTNEEIADEIYISKRAVEKQRQKIYERSNASKAVDFYKYAFTRGLQFLGRMNAAKRRQ